MPCCPAFVLWLSSALASRSQYGLFRAVLGIRRFDREDAKVLEPLGSAALFTFRFCCSEVGSNPVGDALFHKGFSAVRSRSLQFLRRELSVISTDR
jgi:hypothetical protein